MKTGKKQHTIPRFYLNQFIHPGWVYFRGSREPKRVQSAKSQAVQEFYYSQDTDEQNNSLDSLNTSIESETAPILRKLLTTKISLTDTDKLLFSYFIANLALRVPKIIREMGESTLEALEQVDSMAKKIMQKLYKMEIEENQPFIK